ncbi:MAG: hypothetical protein ABRQ24_07930 [Syntrophomonadaceae bacterium]
MLKIVPDRQFYKGDLVTVKNSRNQGPYCILGFKNGDNNQRIAVLKALFNDTDIIEKPESDLKSFLIKGLL